MEVGRGGGYSEGWNRESWNVRLAWATQQDKRNKEKEKPEGVGVATASDLLSLSEISLQKKLLKKNHLLWIPSGPQREKLNQTCLLLSEPEGTAQWQVTRSEVLPGTNKESSSCWRRQARGSSKRPGGMIQSAHIQETDRSNGYVTMGTSSWILILDTPIPLPAEWVIRKPWSLTPGDFVNFIERVEMEAQGSKQVKSQLPSGQHFRSHSLVPSVACRVSRRKTDKMSEVTLDVH